jgi:uncharacterized secreted protein with C-terminal beta-propeller domain
MKKEHTQVVFVWAIAFLLLAVMLSALVALNPNDNDMPVGEYNDSVSSFSNSNDMKMFIDDSRQEYNDRNIQDSGGPVILTGGTFESTAMMDASGSTDYSETNIQVEGVDEPDIVKTDGKYLYVLTRDEVVILRAYPAINAEVVSRIQSNHYASALFVTGSRLVTIGTDYYYGRDPWDSRLYYHGASVMVYDISSRSNPILIQNVTTEGHYLDSRLIGEYIYLAVTYYMWYWYNDDEIRLPETTNNGVTRQIRPWDVYYWADSADSYTLTSILSINVRDSTLNQKVYLTDSGHQMYVSKDHMYLAKYHYIVVDDPDTSGRTWFPNTVVHKIAIRDGRISYVASGIVPGTILNQFSMDEHNGYFRIATTIGQWWWGGEDSKNNVYVLNDDMETVGKLEGLAPGETIYSARFFGNRCYLVTYKKIDPFFVIDLRNPRDPKVLGELKIPGFSTYLHPYDENHVIGIGKNADDQGTFAWFQGMKISLFDVTNVYRPKEVAKVDIGDRGTDSEALHDHKAFLFDRSKDLLIIPVQLREFEEGKDPSEIEPWEYGDFVMQGAFVFSLTLEDGFNLKGTISHMEDEVEEDPHHWYYWGDSYVRRSLYIEDNIYTVSNTMVKINDMDTIDEIKAIGL